MRRYFKVNKDQFLDQDMDRLYNKIDTLLSENNRVFLAISGGPASGKSTLAKRLNENYNDSVILPMDGFHLDNSILIQKNLLQRKGDFRTFDGEGFAHILQRITQNNKVYAPSFDRRLDLSRAGAIEIDQQSLIIIEGNYLALNKSPWRDLLRFYTFSVKIDVSLEMVEKRCIQRWLENGHDIDSANKRARENDVKNALFVQENSLETDMTLTLS